MPRVSHEALAPLQVDIDRLQPHPDNANRGHLKTISESVQAHGVYKPVIYQRGTSYILAGNHTWQAAKDAGLATIPAIGLDVDDTTAKRIMLVDNRARDKAHWDNEALVKLLEDVDDLTGTGYTDTDVNDLLRYCEPPELDELAQEVGEWNPADAWPTVKITCPPTVAQAWQHHLAAHDDPAAAFAALLEEPAV